MDYALPYPAPSLAPTAPAGDPDEARLIRAAQAGDQEAFNQLMARYQRRLYGLAYYLLGEAALADDATQEAMLAAYRSLPSFRHGSLGNWLRRIVTRKCYDHHRATQRRQSQSWEALPEDALPLASRADGPEAFVQRRELAHQLEAALTALPYPDRQLVVLRDIHDLSYQEMAAAAGCPLGTVKSRLSRARAKLRAELRGADD